MSAPQPVHVDGRDERSPKGRRREAARSEGGEALGGEARGEAQEGAMTADRGYIIAGSTIVRQRAPSCANVPPPLFLV